MVYENTVESIFKGKVHIQL